MHYPLTQLWLDIFTPGLTVNLVVPYTEANQQIGLVTGQYEAASVHITDATKPREDVKVRVSHKHPHGVGLFDIPAHNLLNMAWDDHAIRRAHYTVIKALWKKHKERARGADTKGLQLDELKFKVEPGNHRREKYPTPDHSQTGNFGISDPQVDGVQVILSKSRQVGLTSAVSAGIASAAEALPVKVPAEDLKVYEAMKKSLVEEGYRVSPVATNEGRYGYIREGDQVAVDQNTTFVAAFGTGCINHALRYKVISREDRHSMGPWFLVQVLPGELSVDEPLPPPLWVPAERLKPGNPEVATAWAARIIRLLVGVMSP